MFIVTTSHRFVYDILRPLLYDHHSIVATTNRFVCTTQTWIMWPPVHSGYVFNMIASLFLCYVPFVQSSQSATLPTRLFAPASILHFVEAEFSHHLPRYQAACYETLGPHPFRRLDVLVMPKCFASLGLARLVFFPSLNTMVTSD